jgi:hypothetical protein
MVVGVPSLKIYTGVEIFRVLGRRIEVPRASFARHHPITCPLCLQREIRTNTKTGTRKTKKGKFNTRDDMK